MRSQVTSKVKFGAAVVILGALILSAVFEQLGWPNYQSLKPMLGIDSLPEVVVFEIFPLMLLALCWLLFTKSTKKVE